MFLNPHFIAGILVTTLAALLGCVNCADEGFIFPAPSNASKVLFSTLSPHVNDTIVVEYFPLRDASYVALNLACWNSVENATNGEDPYVLTDPSYCKSFAAMQVFCGGDQDTDI